MKKILVKFFNFATKNTEQLLVCSGYLNKTFVVTLSRHYLLPFTTQLLFLPLTFLLLTRSSWLKVNFFVCTIFYFLQLPFSVTRITTSFVSGFPTFLTWRLIHFWQSGWRRSLPSNLWICFTNFAPEWSPNLSKEYTQKISHIFLSPSLRGCSKSLTNLYCPATFNSWKQFSLINLSRSHS